MSAAPFTLAGEALQADPSGALYWPGRRLLAFADLHFEKGSSLASRGVALLPPYDTRATLERMASLLRRYQPLTVVALGDSFHDIDAGARLLPGDRARLSRLVAQTEWVWVEGNHDPSLPPGLGGRSAPELRLDPLVFRHEAEIGDARGEISGHFHPKATVKLRVGRVSARCFLTDGHRLLLPAFGAYAGGLDASDPAIERLFPKGFRALAIGKERIYALTRQQLAHVPAN